MPAAEWSEDRTAQHSEARVGQQRSMHDLVATLPRKQP